MEVKFYLCLTCGNIVCKVYDSGVTPECCGTEMELMVPKSVDNGMEKHRPVVERLDDFTVCVKVGMVAHPQTRDHHIVFIALEMEDGLCIKQLEPSNCEASKCCGSERGYVEKTFCCAKGELIGVYAYCNLHGLWYLPVAE